MTEACALIASRLFTGEAMLEEHALVIEGGKVADIVPAGQAPDRAERLPDGVLLAPGFIDTQVNGGGGTLLNDDPSVAAMERVAAAHRRFGTTALMPTFITDRPERRRLAIAAAREAVERGVPGILGLHLEGPFISLERRGVHRADLVAEMGEEEARELAEPFPGRLIVTLAPERVRADHVRRLAEAGVIVSVGHSAATYAEATAALAEGARGFTHLFNAMRGLDSREPGVVGAALDSDAYAGIIADGHHVHPASLRVALAAKGEGRLMLVSDAMSSIGTEADEFSLQGRRILVRGGRLTTEDGVLAGAHLDMASAVRNAVGLMGASLPAALRMAAKVPAEFLGLGGSHGQLLPGYRADAVALSPSLHAVGTWVGGRRS